MPNKELAEGHDSPPCGLKSNAKTKHSTEGETIKWDRRTCKVGGEAYRDDRGKN